MRYMIIERFKQGKVAAIYERAAQEGRMLPEGLKYIDSWVSSNLDVCFQLMECEEEALFERWISAWCDLTEFEVIPVIGSDEALKLAHSSKK